ncbi:hypothetical protein, partial [Coprobacter sp.]
MNKRLLLGSILVLIIFLTNSFSLKAAVNPVAGSVDPQTSTAGEPKWYTVMSSHMTAQDRQNRFLVWDGIRLKTEKFDNGIPDNQLEDKYLWRLERGSGDNKVYIVNRSGKRIFASAGISPTTNTPLSVNETGVEWEMKLSSATGQSDCAARQYCFNFLGASSSPAYLNAQDKLNDDTGTLAYGVTVFNMGVHQASGWFFYEAAISEQFTYTYTAAAGGSVTASVSGTGIDSGSQFDSGSDIVLTITPESNYE